LVNAEDINKMEDLEKLSCLIGHWIEHGREHAVSYEEWADKIQDIEGGAEIASVLRKAAKKLFESTDCLKELLH